MWNDLQAHANWFAGLELLILERVAMEVGNMLD